MKAIRKEDGTWCTVDDDLNILQHYGVKGMKWHHHKTKDIDKDDLISMGSVKIIKSSSANADLARAAYVKGKYSRLGKSFISMFRTQSVNYAMRRTGARILGTFNNRKNNDRLKKTGHKTKDGTIYTSHSSYVGSSYKN